MPAELFSSFDKLARDYHRMDFISSPRLTKQQIFLKFHSDKCGIQVIKLNIFKLISTTLKIFVLHFLRFGAILFMCLLL